MQIPKINVEADYIPEAWEKMVLAVMENGVDIKTEYDKPEDPPSKDATVSVTINKPLSEPRLHMNIPGGPTDLEVYRQEVVDGIHNHWIDLSDETWEYTYNQKLFEFQSKASDEAHQIDQIDFIVDKLSSSPYSRRAQAITWDPYLDPSIDDPSCLQRIFARLLPDNEGNFCFNARLYWRSRDLWKAWIMNMWGLTSLIENKILKPLNERMNGVVYMGNLVDTMDSSHVYGSYMDDKFFDEIQKMESSDWTRRSVDSSIFEPMFSEARKNLAYDPDHYKKGGDRF